MNRPPFALEEYYHIYNRGVDKRNIFGDKEDLNRFFSSLSYFNTILPIGSIYEHTYESKTPGKDFGGETSKSAENDRLVEFVCYCLNPNHFHFVLRQLVDNGISEFMKRLGGYTLYFNEKYSRSGSLFQGVFKSVHIDTNEYLLHVSAYVNLNNMVHSLNSDELVYSSWNEYIGKSIQMICSKGIILEQFGSGREYQKFAESSLKEMIRRKKDEKEISRLCME